MHTLDKWSILAGLRFLLASIVAVNHLAEFTPLGVLSFIPKFGAFQAILGFLLISGYSISVSYLKEPEHFLLRRFKRIYPVYLASIGITLIVCFCLNTRAPNLGTLLLNIFFLNQLFTTASFVGPAWSLSLECWLYCLAPTLLAAGPDRSRLYVYLSFFSFLLYTSCRTLLHLPYYSAVGYGGNLLFLSFIWICGLRLARDNENSERVMWDIRLIFIVHIALDAVIKLGSRIKHDLVSIFLYEDVLTFAMQSVTLWFVYFLFSTHIIKRRDTPQRSRLLRLLGDISYPLYLIHIPIYALLSTTSIRSPLLYYLATFILSSALYWFIDVYSKQRHLKNSPTS
ncbi:hypothetical protein BH11VER1_BH11VER1_10820 [soil metagenome]